MSDVLAALAVIPARGGSKGVPRKNLRRVSGTTLVEHSIRAALGSRHVYRVVVSTDDPEIASIASAAGAEVVTRPDHLSNDASSSESALLHVLESLDGEIPEILVMIQCTSPLTTAEDIDGAIERMETADADSVFTATRFHHFVWEEDASGFATAVHHDAEKRLRRQDLSPQYLENGAVYVMRTAAFRSTGQRFCGKTAISIMPAERSLEIDSPMDLLVAKVLMHERAMRIRVSVLPVSVEAVVFDFDGVLTDNRLILSEDGTESVRLNRSDGLAAATLRDMGVRLLVLSGEKNPVVGHRCGKLGVEYIDGVARKLPALKEWAEQHGVSLERVVYVGNDANDVECMRAVGAGFAVADARPSAADAASFQLRTAGGDGVVCEIVDLLNALEQEGSDGERAADRR